MTAALALKSMLLIAAFKVDNFTCIMCHRVLCMVCCIMLYYVVLYNVVLCYVIVCCVWCVVLLSFISDLMRCDVI